MLSINKYLDDLIASCKADFADRLLYVGLQGSYLRGEAGEESDIDVMIVLDRLTVADMDTYRKILQKIGHFEKSCGFICGRDEITRWNPLEICQLRFTTKDLFGTLSAFLPESTRSDEIHYVKLSLGNLYHELCHRYIHADRERNVLEFRHTCKGLFFLIQNLYYLESGAFVLKRADLARLVSPEDRCVLSMASLPDGFDFDAAFSAVFAWCQNAFLRLDAVKTDLSKV